MVQQPDRPVSGWWPAETAWLEHEDDAPPMSWIEELRNHLTHHVTAERDLLAEYRRLVAESPDDAVRYLASMILEDEERHHRLFSDLVRALDWQLDLRVGEGSRVPDLPERFHTEGLAELAQRLLRAERQDADDLKDLKKRLRPVRDTTVWTLLVELMELDTRKHQLILEFFEKHAKRS